MVGRCWVVLVLLVGGLGVAVEAANSMSRNTCVGVTVNTQPVPADLSSCCWYNSGTCCSNYVQTLTFPSIEQATQTIYSDPTTSPGCFSALSAVLCAICSPYTASFIEIGVSGSTTFDLQVSVCNTTCVTVYTECGGVVPGTDEVLASPEAFCRALFTEAETVSMPGLEVTFRLDSSHCFEMPNVEIIQNASCMAQYFHGTGISGPPAGGMMTGKPNMSGGGEPHSSPDTISPWRIVGMGLGVAGVGLACGAWFLYQKKPQMTIGRLNLFKHFAGLESSDEEGSSKSTDSEDNKETEMTRPPEGPAVV
jgi:hypothetical protein